MDVRCFLTDVWTDRDMSVTEAEKSFVQLCSRLATYGIEPSPARVGVVFVCMLCVSSVALCFFLWLYVSLCGSVFVYGSVCLCMALCVCIWLCVFLCG